ncbi:MAG: phage Gp37/Gp68 family protein [Pikeienuella sp.]
MSKIEWTERTWNPIVGCSVTSPGCTNCYAMGMAARIERMGGAPQYDGLTTPSKAGPVFNGKVALAEKALLGPLKRKKPTMWFVNSMGDLFHENVPDEWIDRVFAVMALTPQHTYQVLTKRSARMREYVTQLPGYTWRLFNSAKDAGIEGIADKLQRFHQPLPNVWLGVSAEDQTRADERIPDLLDTPAAVRFVSYEPALGPIDFQTIPHGDLRPYPGTINALNGKHHMPEDHANEPGGAYFQAPYKLDWIIAGGESGKSARPMHPDWARQTRDQCDEAGTAFFFKQWGAWEVDIDRDKDDPDWRADYTLANRKPDKYRHINLEGGQGFHGDRLHQMRRTGKKSAGRTLDGVTHDQFPNHP